MKSRNESNKKNNVSNNQESFQQNPREEVKLNFSKSRDKLGPPKRKCPKCRQLYSANENHRC